MTVCMYRDIHTLQPYIVDFTQRGCHTLRLGNMFFFPCKTVKIHKPISMLGDSLKCLLMLQLF